MTDGIDILKLVYLAGIYIQFYHCIDDQAVK